MAETDDARRDKIDVLIDALNEAIPEIPYGRDAMELNTPEDWGAAELNAGRGFWADGMMIDMIYTCNVWTVTADRGTEIMDRVQAVLDALPEDWDVKWQFPERNYLYDLDKVAWHWTVQIPGPLEILEEETDGTEAEG